MIFILCHVTQVPRPLHILVLQGASLLLQLGLMSDNIPVTLPLRLVPSLTPSLYTISLYTPSLYTPSLYTLTLHYTHSHPLTIHTQSPRSHKRNTHSTHRANHYHQGPYQTNRYHQGPYQTNRYHREPNLSNSRSYMNQSHTLTAALSSEYLAFRVYINVDECECIYYVLRKGTIILFTTKLSELLFFVNTPK